MQFADLCFPATVQPCSHLGALSRTADFPGFPSPLLQVGSNTLRLSVVETNETGLESTMPPGRYAAVLL